MSNRALLRALIDTRNLQVQKARKAWGNRKDALERGADGLDSSEQYHLTQDWLEVFEDLESDIDAQIEEVVKEFPIYEHVAGVRGIGPLMAAQLIAFIDVARAPYPSSVWKYAGLGLSEYWIDENGKVMAPKQGFKWNKKKKEWLSVTVEPEPGWELKRLSDRLTAGYRSPYNKRLKTICLGKVATQFMKAGGAYRDEYDKARAHYESRGWTKGHCHRAALRKMVKLFLSHYWERARELRGLETRRTYVEEHLGHGHISSPEDYGWPELGA